MRQGQTLYQIDPSLYQAQVNQAVANVQSARASADAARARAARYKPLAEMEAVSKQDYTDAPVPGPPGRGRDRPEQCPLHAPANQPPLHRVPAPISGRIGLSSVTEGALVTANQAEALTTITRLDPVYVDIQQSAPDLLSLRRSLPRRYGADHGPGPASAAGRQRLWLHRHRSVHRSRGQCRHGFGHASRPLPQSAVAAAAGNVRYRPVCPGDQHHRLSGAAAGDFARPEGNASLWVVGPGNTAVQRTVVAERTDGANWVVTQGLAGGEKVITQGIANLREGAKIKPVPAATPQRIQPAKAAGRAS